MQTVHVMTGLPASGKSLAARRLIDENPGRIRRVNLDDIRAMLDVGANGQRAYSRELEDAVLAIQDSAILAALDGCYDVVVDNTHLTPRIPRRLKALITSDITFKVHDFNHVPIEECIRRDALRTGLAHVGEDVIHELATHRLNRARKGNWRLTDSWMNEWTAARAAIQPYTPDTSLPSAVLCDIDGTLALMEGRRGPYDWKHVGEDAVNEPVKAGLFAFRRLYADRGILLSGRDGCSRKETISWLDRHGIGFDELHMREAGDQRPDDIVKAELFDKHVRHRFNVRLVLDDRDKVVALWRKRLGLPTWQVNYGNF